MLAMLTCPDEFTSKVTLSHKENRTQGPAVPAPREKEAGRGSSKMWEIPAAKCGRVFLTHLPGSPSFFPLPPTIAFFPSLSFFE